ncbi:porin family protein [Mariprofundus ferrooxydans]|uniref:porin family protein n=1 Tax=Mariprofundus ferrooxydans TaxID=314344 RepID=UPI0003823744|nr:porin family protein [Mariprofundus ferrooxydans]
MKRVLVGVAMIVAGGASAQAQDFKPYAGVGIGAFGVESKDGTAAYNQKNTVFGGYGKFGVDINDYVGVELRGGTVGTGDKSYAAATFGTATTRSQTTDYFVSYLGKLQYPVSQDFRLYAMLGATTAKFKVTSSPNVAAANLSKTKTGFSYGFGGDFSVTDQLSVGAEWMQYLTDVKLNATGTTKARLWGAVGTLTMHF